MPANVWLTPWPALTHELVQQAEVYDVDMGRTIGYVGGQGGAAAGYPSTSWVRLIIEGSDEVISAFPTIA